MKATQPLWPVPPTVSRVCSFSALSSHRLALTLSDASHFCIVLTALADREVDQIADSNTLQAAATSVGIPFQTLTLREQITHLQTSLDNSLKPLSSQPVMDAAVDEVRRWEAGVQTRTRSELARRHQERVTRYKPDVNNKSLSTREKVSNIAASRRTSNLRSQAPQ